MRTVSTDHVHHRGRDKRASARSRQNLPDGETLATPWSPLTPASRAHGAVHGCTSCPLSPDRPRALGAQEPCRLRGFLLLAATQHATRRTAPGPGALLGVQEVPREGRPTCPARAPTRPQARLVQAPRARAAGRPARARAARAARAADPAHAQAQERRRRARRPAPRIQARPGCGLGSLAQPPLGPLGPLVRSLLSSVQPRPRPGPVPAPCLRAGGPGCSRRRTFRVRPGVWGGRGGAGRRGCGLPARSCRGGRVAVSPALPGAGGAHGSDGGAREGGVRRPPRALWRCRCPCGWWVSRPGSACGCGCSGSGCE